MLLYYLTDDVDSEEEENPQEDSDTFTNKSDISNQFETSFRISSEKASSLKKTYVLHMAASTSLNRFSTGLSNKTVQTYQLTESDFTIIHEKNQNVYTSPICGIKYMNNDDNLYFCATEEGIIDLIDLRLNKPVHQFEDLSSGTRKPIRHIDVNQNNRVLCGGTNEIDGDVFLLFFDIRERNLLGGYWESHSDDVTQVKFHTTNPNLLASGSTDGLINIFDIANTNEDDALQSCFNTDSSVSEINWHKNVYDVDYISCITHTNDLYFYDVDKNEVFVEFSRENVTESICRKVSSDCNLVGCHNTDDGEIIIVAGSNFNHGECLRSLRLDNKSLTPLGNFVGNKQILRSSFYNHKVRIVFVFG